MIVVVCGGRHARDPEPVEAGLDRIHAETPITKLIEGGQRTYDALGRLIGGVDYFAMCWASKRGIDITTVMADWDQHGRAAGPIRNQRMLDSFHPDMVAAFMGGAGTADMVRRAKAAGVEVIHP